MIKNSDMNKKDLKIVFFGTPEFAVESLAALVDNGYNVRAVVTMPDKIGGRGHKAIESDVKKYALSKNLPLFQPEKLKSPEFIDELRSIDADLFIVIAFRMLPEIVWTMPRLGTFNLHASLLPKYRGAAPINWAIINGETETGVTTFFLKHEIDTGDIISSRKTEIGPDENVGSLYSRLMEIGKEMVIETVDNIISEKLKTQPQPEGEFVPAPKIFKETCRIDWNRNAKEIHNLVRGLSPIPGAFTELIDSKGNVINVKILETSVNPASGLTPGKVSTEGKRLLIGTSDGAIEILSIQPSGKKCMTGHDFLLGRDVTGIVDNPRK